MPRKKPAAATRTHVTTLQMPEAWYETLRDKAHHDRTSMADLIREAMKQQYGLPCTPEGCCTEAE